MQCFNICNFFYNKNAFYNFLNWSSLIIYQSGGAILNKTDIHLFVAQRSRCVYHRVTQRHLYSTSSTKLIININALGVIRPKDSLRQILRGSSSIYLRLLCDFCGISLIEIFLLKINKISKNSF